VEHPHLRVHHQRLLGRIAEELRVEVIIVVQYSFGRHELPVVQQPGFGSPLDQFFAGKKADGFPAVDNIIPEGLDVFCAGKAARHADDGDSLVF